MQKEKNNLMIRKEKEMERRDFYEGIPVELDECVEELAEHVHNMWAEEKLRNGWKYGEKKDSEKKTTPCLVPYNELPEYEKEYDRVTAIGTINFLLKRGFSIEKKNDNDL